MNAFSIRGEQPSALLTDLYQLSMLDAYYRLGMEQTAIFEFFVRRLPERRSFLVAAGLEQVLDYLEGVRFSSEELAWLESTGCVSQSTLERLSTFRFTGRVFAIPEGTVVFAREPIIRVEAPMPEAQLIESRIVNLLHYQTLVASKAARCRLAAPKAELIEFGMRRAHGSEAALLGSRASYIGGLDATATVAASYRYGIPMAGTMAHSFIQAHELETHAFRNFAKVHPDNVVLLLDTYDVARAAHRVVDLAHRWRSEGIKIKGVRIDSGELAEVASTVRSILDRGDCKDVRILVSGALDEYSIDAFCLGTHLTVSEDAPALDCAYKLQQYASRPVRKLSPWKETMPGPRQVYRQYDASGYICMDVLTCENEVMEGKALLREVMTDGHRLCSSPSLAAVRAYCAEELAQLPPALRSLEHVLQSPVKVSHGLHVLSAEVARVNH